MRISISPTVLLILAALFLSAGNVRAQEEGAATAESQDAAVLVTQKGYAACVDRGKFHNLMALVAREQRAEYGEMLADSASGCFHLKEGVVVQVVTNAVTFVEVRPDGMRGTIWTVPEALARRGGGDPGEVR